MPFTITLNVRSFIIEKTWRVFFFLFFFHLSYSVSFSLTFFVFVTWIVIFMRLDHWCCQVLLSDISVKNKTSNLFAFLVLRHNLWVYRLFSEKMHQMTPAVSTQNFRLFCWFRFRVSHPFSHFSLSVRIMKYLMKLQGGKIRQKSFDAIKMW